MNVKKTAISAIAAAMVLAFSTAAQPQAPQTDKGAKPADRAAPAARDASPRDARTDRRDNKVGDKIGAGDRHFIRDAAQHGAAEVELANIAKTKAASDQVKKYAEKIAADHAKANEELKQIASTFGVKLPDNLERKDKRAIESLARASGADFDRKFMQAMLKDHERDLKDFRKEAKGAKNPELKAFAEKGAALVESHLNEAKTVAAAVGLNHKGRVAKRDAPATASTGSGPMQGGAPATRADKDSSGNK